MPLKNMKAVPNIVQTPHPCWTFFFQREPKLSRHIKLNHYCRKQHKNNEISQINEENVVMSLCPSLFTATCTPFAFLSGKVFSILGDTVLRTIT